MTEYIHLAGAEDVRTAANRMVHAAELMQRAVDNFDGALFRHQQFMDNWLERLQQVLEMHTLGETEKRT